MKKNLILFILLITVRTSAQLNPFITNLPGERMVSFECTKDGGYIVNTESNNYAITKLDSNGQIKWSYINNQFDGTDSSNGLTLVKQTLDGGYLGVGSIEPNNQYDMIAVKLDSLGNVQWKKKWDRYSLEGFLNFIVEDDSTFTVLGTDSSGYFTVSLNQFGDTSTTISIPNNHDFLSSNLIYKQNNKYLLSGINIYTLNTEWYFNERVRVLDSSRNSLGSYELIDSALVLSYFDRWLFLDSNLYCSNVYGSVNLQIPKALEYNFYKEQRVAENNITLDLSRFIDSSTIIGTKFTSSSNDTIYIYEENITSLSTRKIGYFIPSTVFDSELYDIKRDSSLNVIISGRVDPQGLNAPFLARIIDTAAVGIKEQNLLKNQPLLIYPNPTSGTLNIEIPKEIQRGYSQCTIKVFDATGKNLIACNCSPNTTMHKLELKPLPPGLYLLNVSGIKNQHYTSKFIIH